jgi:hypothetical protein
LAIISGLTGFIVSKYIESSVLDKVFQRISDTATDVGVSKGQADSAAKDTAKILAEAKLSKEQVDKANEAVQGILNARDDAIRKDYTAFSAQLLSDQK